ncbi:hypothetical protein WKW50_16300 [Ochrobactrum sp. GPK 3]
MIKDDDDLFPKELVEAIKASKTPRYSFTLFVFENREHARLAGFDGHFHPLDEKLMAWWPTAGEVHIASRVFPKIIICRGAILSRETQELLRNRQMTFKNRIWIEL